MTYVISANIQKYEIEENYPNILVHFFVNILIGIALLIMKFYIYIIQYQVKNQLYFIFFVKIKADYVSN
ncbi:MAG TPA: hypothetical protein DIW37_02515 [Chryseobacterium sp.]|uniref:Uncharacterized protein n=2 Tax=Chryseobacterium TaxID=59732 RepID=A0A3D9B7Z2_9FLAO|nr:hypothetical protein B0E34_17430 [Chryseobacterium mucoviscidosis]REC49820.1 hypothetical protein DRF68_10245 [Candidatus Chryseobacterium massiliae]HAO08088.1 hypothetical protein [Chryseobacterium sp.]HCR75282.1 hypothetical protein [Chryseobacterium sp.]